MERNKKIEDKIKDKLDDLNIEALVFCKGETATIYILDCDVSDLLVKYDEIPEVIIGEKLILILPDKFNVNVEVLNTPKEIKISINVTK